jgi:hypothetical protein
VALEDDEDSDLDEDSEFLTFIGAAARLTSDDLEAMTLEEHDQLDRDLTAAVEWLEAFRDHTGRNPN